MQIEPTVVHEVTGGIKKSNETNKLQQLTITLLQGFGGFAQNESTCEMAIRVLKQQKQQIIELNDRIHRLEGRSLDHPH